MKFRTEFDSTKISVTLNPAKPVVLAGSCFSQNIASKMEQHLWKGVNPLGTLYNPFSIGKAIELMLDLENGSRKFEESLFFSQGLWNSFWFDSSFSSADKNDSIEEFSLRQKAFIENLEVGETLIVTFGTSICYYLNDDPRLNPEKYLNLEIQPVGNCHKEPAAMFYRKRASVTEITSYWVSVITALRKRIPQLKVIFTVSPVRHLKDGFEGNARSKAILLLAVEEIVDSIPECYYFPAYEILNDDLRDYRFYASDLTHPSEEAVSYIWEKFCDMFLDSTGFEYIREGNKKYKSSRHREKTGALGKPLKKDILAT